MFRVDGSRVYWVENYFKDPCTWFVSVGTLRPKQVQMLDESTRTTITLEA